jgi:uncharacterized damage-inducible protein DinB
MSKRVVLSSLACGLALLALAPAGSRADTKSEMTMWIQDAEEKLIDLAGAMPESKYSWRPAKDVRSVGEVYMHVVTANYGVPALVGVATPPEGFNIQTSEKSLTKKADIQKALKDSFAHMRGALAKLSDEDLEKPAEFFGMKTTVRGAYFLLLSHAHEHLGQSIAYARSNGVTPPWTAREQAAAREKAKEKEAKAAATK